MTTPVQIADPGVNSYTRSPSLSVGTADSRRLSQAPAMGSPAGPSPAAASTMNQESQGSDQSGSAITTNQKDNNNNQIAPASAPASSTVLGGAGGRLPQLPASISGGDWISFVSGLDAPSLQLVKQVLADRLNAAVPAGTTAPASVPTAQQPLVGPAANRARHQTGPPGPVPGGSRNPSTPSVFRSQQDHDRYGAEPSSKSGNVTFTASTPDYQTSLGGSHSQQPPFLGKSGPYSSHDGNLNYSRFLPASIRPPTVAAVPPPARLPNQRQHYEIQHTTPNSRDFEKPGRNENAIYPPFQQKQPAHQPSPPPTSVPHPPLPHSHPNSSISNNNMMIHNNNNNINITHNSNPLYHRPPDHQRTPLAESQPVPTPGSYRQLKIPTTPNHNSNNIDSTFMNNNSQRFSSRPRPPFRIDNPTESFAGGRTSPGNRPPGPSLVPIPPMPPRDPNRPSPSYSPSSAGQARYEKPDSRIPHHQHPTATEGNIPLGVLQGRDILALVRGAAVISDGEVTNALGHPLSAALGQTMSPSRPYNQQAISTSHRSNVMKSHGNNNDHPFEDRAPTNRFGTDHFGSRPDRSNGMAVGLGQERRSTVHSNTEVVSKNNFYDTRFAAETPPASLPQRRSDDLMQSWGHEESNQRGNPLYHSSASTATPFPNSFFPGRDGSVVSNTLTSASTQHMGHRNSVGSASPSSQQRGGEFGHDKNSKNTLLGNSKDTAHSDSGVVGYGTLQPRGHQQYPYNSQILGSGDKKADLNLLNYDNNNTRPQTFSSPYVKGSPRGVPLGGATTVPKIDSHHPPYNPAESPVQTRLSQFVIPDEIRRSRSPDPQGDNRHPVLSAVNKPGSDWRGSQLISNAARQRRGDEGRGDQKAGGPMMVKNGGDQYFSSFFPAPANNVRSSPQTKVGGPLSVSKGVDSTDESSSRLNSTGGAVGGPNIDLYNEGGATGPRSSQQSPNAAGLSQPGINSAILQQHRPLGLPIGGPPPKFLPSVTPAPQTSSVTTSEMNSTTNSINNFSHNQLNSSSSNIYNNKGGSNPQQALLLRHFSGVAGGVGSRNNSPSLLSSSLHLNYRKNGGDESGSCQQGGNTSGGVRQQQQGGMATSTIPHGRPPQQRTFVLNICLPVTIPGGELYVTKTSGENFYHFPDTDPGARMLFSPDDGICDAWASFMQVKMGHLANVKADQINGLIQILRAVHADFLSLFGSRPRKLSTSAVSESEIRNDSSNPPSAEPKATEEGNPDDAKTDKLFPSPIHLRCSGIREAFEDDTVPRRKWVGGSNDTRTGAYNSQGSLGQGGSGFVAGVSGSHGYNNNSSSFKKAQHPKYETLGTFQSKDDEQNFTILLWVIRRFVLGVFVAYNLPLNTLPFPAEDFQPAGNFERFLKSTAAWHQVKAQAVDRSDKADNSENIQFPKTTEAVAALQQRNINPSGHSGFASRQIICTLYDFSARTPKQSSCSVNSERLKPLGSSRDVVTNRAVDGHSVLDCDIAGPTLHKEKRIEEGADSQTIVNISTAADSGVSVVTTTSSTGDHDSMEKGNETECSVPKLHVPIVIKEYGEVQNCELLFRLMNDAEFSEKHVAENVVLSELRLEHVAKKMVDPRFRDALVLTRQMAGDENPALWSRVPSTNAAVSQSALNSTNNQNASNGSTNPVDQSIPVGSGIPEELKIDNELPVTAPDGSVAAKRQLNNSGSTDANNNSNSAPSNSGCNPLLGRIVLADLVAAPSVRTSYTDASTCLDGGYAFVYRRHLDSQKKRVDEFVKETSAGVATAATISAT